MTTDARTNATLASFNGFPLSLLLLSEALCPAMRRAVRIVLKLRSVVLVAALLVGYPARAVEVEFTPLSAADQWDARTYQAIWAEFGPRIIAAFETVTCLPFAEPRVGAIVAEDVSHSGGPEHPMQLRASYVRAVKQATLVHELGHRHLWQLAERLDGIDGHMTLYLVLDEVWAQVWGREFAAKRIESESDWQASYDYRKAWQWARSLPAAERARLWDQLLIRNGFAGGCRGLTAKR
jgi:hypothetical protein